MRRIKYIGFALIFITISNNLFSQNSAQISQPDLELVGNKIIISYQILRSSNADLFNIWIEVSDENGNSLNARSLSGDVGQNIRGGGNKVIKWNYERDIVSLGEGIGIQVFGELLNPQIKSEVESPGTNQSARNMDSNNGGTITKSGAILRSVAVPGWGLSAMTGKSHWLKGVAGYGAIASSLVLNRTAYKNYNLYLDSSDQSEFNGYIEKAVSQQNLSKISAYVAAGIWVADIIWTLMSDSGNEGFQSYSKPNRISLGTVYEPSVMAPLVAFRYNF